MVNMAAAMKLLALAIRSPDRRAAIAAEGAIPALVKCLRSIGPEPVQAMVVNVLANISIVNSDRSAAIASEGAIPLLVQYLRVDGAARFC
jgi:hypothetical protein